MSYRIAKHNIILTDAEFKELHETYGWDRLSIGNANNREFVDWVADIIKQRAFDKAYGNGGLPAGVDYVRD